MLVEDLERHSNKLFSDRQPLDSLWQEQADHFYPERADFTHVRNIGTEFASGIMSSYPLLVRRDLGNSFSSMLRPTGKAWMDMTVDEDEAKLNIDSKRWLEWATGVMRRAMYDRKTNFIRATKEGDHDFATFGNAAITTELGSSGNTLLYRSWHLRDVVWCEGPDAEVDTVYHRWKPTVSTLVKMFGNNVPGEIREQMDKDPYKEIECRRAVMSADRFNDSSIRGEWVSVYYTLTPKHILKIEPLAESVWTIPRWTTVSGSQYGFSPATIIALPDARLIQAMTRVILEAGEKFTNPPLLAVQEALRGDVQLMAGGITWVDAEYDERLGEVLRPLTQDKSGMQIGVEMRQDIMLSLREAFFLNKIEMPNKPQEMTAYEVSQRVSEYIRMTLPLFEPMETDYNGSLCEITFNTLMRNGAFGPMDSIPEQLHGRDIRFKFRSPLQAALDSEKMASLQQAKAALALVADVDPTAINMFDARKALRDALHGVQVPSAWIRSEKEMQDITDAQQEEVEAEKSLEAMVAAAGASKDIAAAQNVTGNTGAPQGVR